ncbi:hypothetical protein B0A48_10890 [Cryoendolithus antarcticus]|uniref:Heterokaryon incompatibility domain-containing protein n=1 Tax=Cryoendolithus antarcticus TaxID=1507870 RepID=A0A1V8SYX4_9PEZI|nr:hypothetical protein B0A48_10890 [Cryoendolithus antarcticus]
MADDRAKAEIWPRPTIPRRPATAGPGREDQHAPRLAGWKQAIAAVQEKNKKMYRYSALPKDTARLVFLKKKEPHDNDIFVELLQIPFNELDEHDYVALSYHWGRGEVEKPIYLHDLSVIRDGTAGSGPKLGQLVDNLQQLLRNQFWVKLNLYNALLNIRNECAWNQNLKIWVDAVCIDQGNADEKEEQMARMSEIYSKAAKVLIWLGGGNDASKEAIRFLRDDLSDLDEVRALVLDRGKAESWGNLVYLMQSSWFSRRWIIQELAFARDAIVYCGNDCLHWDDLRDGISLFAENFDSVRSLLGSEHKAITAIELMKANSLIDTINNIFKTQSAVTGTEREPLQGLEYLVSTLSAYDTADPRDTINAFRNISKETYRSLTTDYTHTWHTENPPPSLDYKSSLLEVYAGFVRWVYTSTRCIDIICRRWAIPERSPEHAPAGYVFSKLPSWIQTVDYFVLKDKSMGSRRHGNCFVGMPGKSPYNACHNIVANVHFGTEMPPPPLTISSSPIEEPDTEAGTNAANGTGRLTSDSLGVSQHVRRRAASASQVPSVRVSPPSYLVPPEGTPVKRKRHDTLQDHGDDFAQVDTPLPSSKRAKQSALHIDLSNVAAREHDVTRSSARRKGSALLSPIRPPSPAWSDVAGDVSSVQSLVQDNNACVHIEGLRIGEVTWVVGPTTNGVVPESALRRLFGRGVDLDAENVSDRVWRSLIAERGSHGEHSPVLSHKSCMWVIANNSAEGYIYTKELLQNDPPPPEPVKQYLKRVQEVIWDRCCIEVRHEGPPLRAGKDLYGFAPSKAQKGDILCVLFGCTVPCLLRKCKDLEGVYRLVGETYVYGLMDGEAISSRAKKRLERDRTYFKIV